MGVTSGARPVRLIERGALRPEHRLIVACAGAHWSPEHRQELEQLTRGHLDWPVVLTAARAHRVVALCYSALRDSNPATVPADVLAALRAGAMATAARNLRMAAKLVEIVACAGQAGIPLVPYKGAVLAELAYWNLGLREFVDLDFILPHDRLRAARDLLEGLGYHPANPARDAAGNAVPGEYPFLAPGENFHVELHTELTLRHFPSPPDLRLLIAARKPVTLVGQQVLTFSPEDTLTLLAVHGAKDFWAQLLWVGDIAGLCQTEGFDWDRALEGSRRMGCRRMVNVALLLARNLLEAPIPDEVKRQAEADVVAQRQAAWLAARLFHPGPTGLREQLRYRMRMVEGFWRGVGYAARLATTPAADDWNALPLPAPLRFAYALLRPLRLFRR